MGGKMPETIIPVKLRKDGKPKRKTGPKTPDNLVRSERSTRRQLLAKPQNDTIREEIILAMLQGQYNPKLLYELSNKYKWQIGPLRNLAEQAFQLVKLLQSTNDNPEEAKSALKSDINQKLHNLYELSIKKQDYRTCNNILVSLAKLNSVMEPEKIEITNAPQFELTQVELQYIRETGKLPETVLADWQQLPPPKPPEPENENK